MDKKEKQKVEDAEANGGGGGDEDCDEWRINIRMVRRPKEDTVGEKLSKYWGGGSNGISIPLKANAV